MARLTRLRVSALADLAEQLRFAPRAAALRQIDAAERLALEIDPARNYPLSWVARRLTGFRPPEDDAETLIVGAALAGDVSAFVEGISSRVGLSLADLGPGAMTLEDLCARWGVDRKTIERRRREGLVGRRIVGADGRGRLAFTLAAVERFERAAAPRGGLGRAPARADARTRETVARLARRAQRRETRPGAEVARTLHARWGERLGVSERAMRRLIERATPEAGAARGREPGPVTDRESELALRAWRRGVSAPALAARLGRSRASVHRVVNERRAALLRAQDLSCPSSPTFERPDAAETLLAPPAVRDALGAPGERDIAGFRALAESQGAPGETDERSRAVAMCFLRWRAADAIATLPRFNPSADALDEIETGLRWAALVAIGQARSQARLAMRSIEERAGRPMADLAPGAARAAHRAAMLAIVRAAWAFDPFGALGGRAEGRRLAAGATAGIAKELSSLVERGALGAPGAQPAPGRASARRGAPAPLEDWTRWVAPWQRWLDPLAGAREGLSRLDPLRREAVRLRFGWGTDGGAGGPPLTRAGVATRLGTTAARVVRLEREGVRVAAGLSARARERDR